MSVLVGYVDRPEARAALQRGVEESRLRGLTLHVVAFVVVEAPGGAEVARREAAHLRAEEAALEAIRAHLAGEVDDFELHVVLETPGNRVFIREFKRLAERVEAQLVVIGLRQRSLVGKVVLGSRAQDILLAVDCDVLAVKAPDDDGDPT